MKSYKSKGIINKVKRQYIEWRKYLQVVSDERLISKTCRNSYNSIVKIQEPNFKMGKELENPSLLNKHNIGQQVYKKVFNIIVSRDMQTKQTLRYYTIKIAKINKEKWTI